MPKVLCTLPNASTLISGVQFVSHANGMLSEDISDAAAADFAAIPGYAIVGAPDAAAADAAAAAAATERADLLARAEALDFKVKAVWGIDRLRAEVEGAERAAVLAAEAAAAKTE